MFCLDDLEPDSIPDAQGLAKGLAMKEQPALPRWRGSVAGSNDGTARRFVLKRFKS
jgi:hypothetical protein